MNKITTKVLIGSIFQNYLYPVHITPNQFQWRVSQDIQNQQFLLFLEAIEEFSEKAATSAELPFVIEKDLQGTHLKRTNPTGELFYKLLAQSNNNLINIKSLNYEASENAKVFFMVFHEMNLSSVMFTFNPLTILNIFSGLLEGELINTFVTRLRAATQQKTVKDHLVERKNESIQSFKKSKQYIQSLQTNHPNLFWLRLVLCYSIHHAPAITLKESNEHLIKFLQALETEPTLGLPIGWWWKREYMTETSYRYYLITFFDGINTPYNPMLIKTYGDYWLSATQNLGSWIIPPIPDINNSETLLFDVECMLKRDNLLRLEHNPKSDNFGMGETTKSAKK